MEAEKSIDNLLLSAIESGRLDQSTDASADLAVAFAAHQKIESLFALLRQPVGPTGINDESPTPSAVGRYLVRSQLGHGAFGVVYLADDPELNRLVAIKTQKYQRPSSPAVADAFLSEARLAARLKHPAIVPVYDIWRDEERCYIVMAFIEGRTLENLLRSERQTPHRIADLLAQVADAIHYAHRQGFVHRDLKPANILVDSAGKAHVADFGLAITEDSQQLFASQVAGTPAYMSPEQIRGEAHRLDGRSDIWSLGVILYEALAGRHPFWRGNAADCLDEIQHREPKPPRQIDDTIPTALEEVTLRCLAKQITDRPKTAADVATALRSWMVEGSGSANNFQSSPLAIGQTRTVSSFRFLTALATVCLTLIAVVSVVIWAPNSAQNHSSKSESLTSADYANSPETSALDARVDVLIWNDEDRNRQRLSLKSPDALPLRHDDQIRIEAFVRQPRYLYLIWIGADGIARPVYPWVPGNWKERPATEQPTTSIALPSDPAKGWPLDGPGGMETLMLLGRDTPLPPEVDLADLCANLPKQPFQDPKSVVWFEKGRLVTEGDRSPQFFNEKTIDDPVLLSQELLSSRLRPFFPVVTGASFAYRSSSGD